MVETARGLVKTAQEVAARGWKVETTGREVVARGQQLVAALTVKKAAAGSESRPHNQGQGTPQETHLH